MIPQFVNGDPVKYYAILEKPIFPFGYPGDGPLEKTKAFLISVSNEGNQTEERFWFSCIGINDEILAGDMCFSLEGAMKYPISEFAIKDLKWEKAF